MTNLKRNISIALVLFISSFIGFIFNSSSSLVSSMWPAIGFSVAYYLIFGKKVLPGILIGSLSAQLINALFILNDPFLSALVTSTIFTSASILEAVVFRFFIRALYKERHHISVTVLIIFSGFIVSALIGSLYCTGLLLLKTTGFGFWIVASRYFSGILSGMMNTLRNICLSNSRFSSASTFRTGLSAA